MHKHFNCVLSKITKFSKIQSMNSVYCVLNCVHRRDSLLFMIGVDLSFHVLGSIKCSLCFRRSSTVDVLLCFSLLLNQMLCFAAKSNLRAMWLQGIWVLRFFCQEEAWWW